MVDHEERRIGRFLLLCILYSLDGLSGATWGRFGTIYYNAIGLSELEVGIVSAALPLVRFVAAPLWGCIADTLSAKKWVSLVTRGASSALLLLLALPWVVHTGFYAVLAVCVAMSFFVSPGVIDSYTIEWLGPKRRNCYGKVRVWTAIAWGLGAVAMGIITDRYGFNWNFILFGAMQGLQILTTAVVIPGHDDGSGRCSLCCNREARSRERAEEDGLAGEGNATDVVLLGDGAIAEEEWDPYRVRDAAEEWDENSLDVNVNGDEVLRDSDSDSDLNAFSRHRGAAAADPSAALALPTRGACGLFTPRALAFFGEMFVMGAAASVVEKLLFLFLVNDLGASTTLCGLSVGVTVILEIPLFCASDVLLKRLGHDAMMLIAMAAYIVRVYCYCLLTPATRHWILALECLHGITFALLWSAAVERTSQLTSPEWGSTAQSILAATYQCLGSAFGSIVGGWAMQRFGSVAMYRVASYTIAALFVVHLGVITVAATLRCLRRACSRGA